MDSQFGSLPGVVRTRVGYTGGTTDSPTYERLGDHTESVEIEYDPSRISYQQLLDVFWASHTPTLKPYARQYITANRKFVPNSIHVILRPKAEESRLTGQERDPSPSAQGDMNRPKPVRIYATL